MKYRRLILVDGVESEVRINVGSTNGNYVTEEGFPKVEVIGERDFRRGEIVDEELSKLILRFGSIIHKCASVGFFDAFASSILCAKLAKFSYL